MHRLTLIILITIGASGAWAQPSNPLQVNIAALDRNINEVFARQHVASYPHAVRAYLDLLRNIPQATTEEDRQTATRHLRYISMVMPEEDPARLVLDQLLEEETVDAETLISWWNRQDPLPSSAENERVQEHLARIAYAQEHYADDNDMRGVDDRGEIYIRLGTPYRTQQIKIVSAGVWLNPYSAKLPDNDFWEYRHIDKEAHYLFVRPSPRRPYKIATSEDLIPRELVASRRRVGLLIPVMEEVFAQLALAHPYYGTTYDALNSYMSVPGGTGADPYQFARRILTKMRLDDDFYDDNRKQIVPVSYTNALRGAETLDPALRWARFLEPNGQTRVELYWGLAAADLAPSNRLLRRLRREGHAPTPRYLITFSVAERNSRFEPHAIDTQHFSVSTTPGHTLRTQSWSTVSAAPLIHLSTQWEQRWARFEEDGSITPGATLKIGTRMVDSLTALPRDSSRLVISDIRPLSLTIGTTPEDAALLPFEELSSDTPLALYFEVYHLTYGHDDLTRFTVEYRIESVSRREPAPLAVSSSYSGAARTAREHIGLDLSTWDTIGPLVITVRVTDELSGQSVSRAIRFRFSG